MAWLVVGETSGFLRWKKWPRRRKVGIVLRSFRSFQGFWLSGRSGKNHEASGIRFW